MGRGFGTPLREGMRGRHRRWLIETEPTDGPGLSPDERFVQEQDEEPGLDVPDPSLERRHPFTADLDVCELDHRSKQCPKWGARAVSLSRSALSFRSRRMCYERTRLLVFVHLIDAKPVLISGSVRSCVYDADGLYLIDLEFERPPMWSGDSGASDPTGRAS